MPVKAKNIKDLPLKNELDGSESLLVQDSNGTKQAPLEVIVDEIKQNSQEKIREIESELDQTNAQLSGIENKIVTISVLDFGAVCDGVHDDTKAFNDAFNSIPSFNTKSRIKYVVTAPKGKYKITDTVLINKMCDVDFLGDFIFYGERNRSVLKIMGLTECSIKLERIIDNASLNDDSLYTGWHGWEDESYCGVETVNLKQCKLNIRHIRNFTVGHKCCATTGYWFNTVTVDEITNCKIGLMLSTSGADGWMNANYFYNTAFGYSGSNQPFQTANVDRYDIKQVHENGSKYMSNSNSFFNMKFESHGTFGGSHTSIYINRAAGWLFDNFRCELQSPQSQFCVINCENDKTINTYQAHSHEIKFNSYLYLEGANVKLINNTRMRCDYSSVYSFNKDLDIINLSITSPYFVNSTLRVDEDYRSSSKFRFTDIYSQANLDVALNNYRGYRSGLSSTVVNGVKLLSNYPLMFYFTVSLNKTYRITVNKGATFSLKLYDSSKNIILSESTYTLPIACGGYYKEKYGAIDTGSVKEKFTFSVNNDCVKYVAVLISGDLENIQINSNDIDTQVFFNDTSENHLNGLFLNATKPTYIDENSIVGTKVFKYDDLKTYWEIEKVDNVLQWIAK